jgi:hypothetical protein
MATTSTPKEVAQEFGTDAKTLRKFLRSITPIEDRPGKGGRWSLPATKKQLTTLRKRFDEWETARALAAAEAKAQAEADAEVEGDDADEVEVDANEVADTE